MPDKSLPHQPSLEQYRKQAKDLLHQHRHAESSAPGRIARHHPRLQGQSPDQVFKAAFLLADAQLVIAREHGFESWPKFASHVTQLQLAHDAGISKDPVAAFIEAACVPLDWHASGTIDEAESILARYPSVATASIHTAAVLADEITVRASLARDPAAASAKGGPRDWDALTHLCFSRYLRLDRARSDAFVRCAEALLDAGANPNTGWIEIIDHPNPRPILESAIYGAAGIARNAPLTRLLLERGADPNDEETPYHVAETRDNTVLKVLLESGKLTPRSLSTLLLRKCDWHDLEGVRLLLERGADPNQITVWGQSALHQAMRRDNSIAIVECLLDGGANPALPNREGSTSVALAARRGRGAVLEIFEQRGTPATLTGIDALIAACARDQKEAIQSLTAAEPFLKSAMQAHGGTLLAHFSGVGNVAGVRNLLNLGISPVALYYEGDGYFGIAKASTALHVAAWRAWPDVVKELIRRGAAINATDGQGRTPLQLAVKACVDSYWTDRRSPDSIRALLEAGASAEGIALPTGYAEADRLLREYTQQPE